MKIIRYNSMSNIDWFNNRCILKPSNIEVNSNSTFGFSKEEIESAKQKIGGKHLKLSRYNFIKTFDDNYSVVFNSLYDSVVVLNPKETSLYHTLDKRDAVKEFDAALFLLGIFLTDMISEDVVVGLLQDNLFYNINGIPSITILPTQACNAKCAYCFADHNKKITMTNKISENVINYISNNFKEGDSVLLRWFGGEPLLAESIIDTIVDGISSAFNNRLNFKSLIFTNGSMLNDNLAKKAKTKWNVTKVQLTLDGYATEHSTRKNYNDQSIDYYVQVINNIKTLLRFDIAVDCRINLDKDNFNQLDKILNDLTQFINNPSFRVRVTILRPSDCGDNLFNYIKPSDLKWVYGVIYQKLFHYGFIKDIKSILPKRRIESCIAKSINKVIIGADGILYKCLQQVFNEEYSVGNLLDGISYNKYISNYCKKSIHEECERCIFLPLCEGGCEAYWNLQGNQDITPCIREKYFFDSLLQWIYRWSQYGGYDARIFCDTKIINS